MSFKNISPLLPIHAARERRAQREYHAHTQSYELALSAQMNASLAVRKLQQNHQALLADVINSDSLSSELAQILLVGASSLEAKILEAHRLHDDLSRRTYEALSAMREAQKIYAEKAKTSKKMIEANSRIVKKGVDALHRSNEQNADEDFSLQWSATQKGNST